MILEFQLSSEILGRIVRNRLHQFNLCVEDPFPIKDLANLQVMVNRIHVPTSTTLERQPNNSFPVFDGTGKQTVNGFKAVLRQPLRLDIVAVNTLIQNGKNPTPSIIPNGAEIAIFLDITAFVENGTPKLQFALPATNPIDFQPLEQQLSALTGGKTTQLAAETKSDIIKKVKAKLTPIKREIPLSSIQEQFQGGSIAVTNAGATASPSSKILIIRMEVNGAADPLANWTDFYNTYDRDLLGEHQWAMLVDKGVIIPAIRQRLLKMISDAENAVTNKDDDQYFSLESSVGVSWNPVNGPSFDVTFSGIFHNACECLVNWPPLGKVDVDVDISIANLLKVAEGKLRTESHISYDEGGLKSECCKLTGALLWPIAGVILLSNKDINFGEYLAGFIYGPFAAYILCCNIAANQSIVDQLDLPSDGECKKQDDETVICDQPFSMNLGAIGGDFLLSTVEAQQEGPVFSGAVTGIQEWLDPELSITSVKELVNDPTTMALTWILAGSCSTGLNPQASGSISCQNATKGFSSLKICHASPLSDNDDPDHCFDIATPGSVNITLRTWKSDLYFQKQYSWKLLIVTNGGIRIMTVAPVQQMTSQQIQDLNGQAELAAKLCKSIQQTKVKWRIPEPDPPEPEWLIIGQLWELVVANLKPDESVDLIGGDDRVVATAFANRLGVAELSYWAEGGTLLPEIGVRINVPQGRSTRDAWWHISGKQARLLLQSQVALPGTFESMSIEKPENETMLSVQTATAKAVYDISTPQSPSLQSRVTITESDKRPSQYDADLAKLVAQRKIKDTKEIIQIEQVNMTGAKRALYLLDQTGTGRIMDMSDSNSVREMGRYSQMPWFVNSYRSGKIFAKLALDGKHISIYEISQIMDI